MGEYRASQAVEHFLEGSIKETRHGTQFQKGERRGGPGHKGERLALHGEGEQLLHLQKGRRKEQVLIREVVWTWK